jgi:hypothetical protein
MMRDKLIGVIESTLGKMIGPAVATSWMAVGTAIDAIEKPTEEKIREAVKPLFEVIQKLKDSVQAKFDEKVNPVIGKLCEPITQKLLPKLYQPLQKCMEKLISEFVEHKDSERGSYYLYWEIRGKLDDFDDVLSVAREILDVEELGELSTKVNNACTTLLERAYFTQKTHKAKGIAQPFEQTCNELLHDAIMDMNAIAKWVLDVLVLKPFNEAFGAIVTELCGPLEELIPEPIKAFLSPSDTIKEMGRNVVSSVLRTVLASGGDQSGPLVAKFVDKGVKDIQIIAGPVAAAAPAAEETKTGE